MSPSATQADHLAGHSSGLPARWALRGGAAAASVGALVGLVVGLAASPPTAAFAMVEVALPSFIVGALIGFVTGTIAVGVTAHTGRGASRRRTDPGSSTLRWPDVVVAIGAVVVLDALSSMEWASRVDDVGRTTFTVGPTGLLASAAVASLVLSLLVIATRWRWPRWPLVATALATAVSAVVVALARIVAANDSGQGATTTSYERGALVGVGAAFVVAACALINFANAYKQSEPTASAVHSSPGAETRLPRSAKARRERPAGSSPPPPA